MTKNEKIIEIRCTGADAVPLDELQKFQGGLKRLRGENLEKLKTRISTEGFTSPFFIWNDSNVYRILDGHGRKTALEALKKEGYQIPPLPVVWIEATDAADARSKLLGITSQYGEFDTEELAEWIDELSDSVTETLRLVDSELSLIFGDTKEEETEEDDALPPEIREPISVIGDLWQLGKHRLLCGDSTDPGAIGDLFEDQIADLILADPPYGMGKESDGVLNDNLYREKLDAFQMAWWKTWRQHTRDNGSTYIWGNAPDLWRLWYVGGLGDSEKLELQNEIVWNKKNIPGMASPLSISYPIITERCLFIQIGKQYTGNVNTEDYFEEFEPVRSYLEGEAKAAGIKPGDVKRVCGVGMYSHWFTKSQWCFIPRNHYETLADEYVGFFSKDWKELRDEYREALGGYESRQAGLLGDRRSYFDGAWDAFGDVLNYPRVVGEERFEHATPKPVDMMAHMVKTSCPPGGIVGDPFGGTGPTLIACEREGRIWFGSELSPNYCDVIVTRYKNWMEANGREAVILRNGEEWHG